MAERYFMYDPALRDSVMRLLRRWKRLPLSDLFELLSPEDRLRYRDDVIEDLVWQGLISREVIGDETVISLSTRGEQGAVGAEENAGSAEPR